MALHAQSSLVTHAYIESKVVLSYPDTDKYPKFYSLAGILKGMVELTLNINSQTKEMLSSLDQ